MNLSRMFLWSGDSAEVMRGGSKNIYPERGNHYNVSIMDRNERRSVVMALLLAVGC